MDISVRMAMRNAGFTISPVEPHAQERGAEAMNAATRIAIEEVLYAVACERVTNAVARVALHGLFHTVDFRTWHDNTIEVMHIVTGKVTEIEI